MIPGARRWPIEPIFSTMAACEGLTVARKRRHTASVASKRCAGACTRPRSGLTMLFSRPLQPFHDLSDLVFAGDLGVAVDLNGTILVPSNAGAEWRTIP